MKTETIILIFLLGLVTTYVLKYLIFGLEAWDNVFHPERLQADINGPYARFAKPFLGLLPNAS